MTEVIHPGKTTVHTALTVYQPVLRRLTVHSNRHKSFETGCNQIYFCYVTLWNEQKL